MIHLNSIVKLVNPLPDENSHQLYKVIELNGDRALIEAINTGLTIAPTQIILVSELSMLLYTSLAGVQVLETKEGYTTISPDTTTLTHLSLNEAMYIADNWEPDNDGCMGSFDENGDTI